MSRLPSLFRFQEYCGRQSQQQPSRNNLDDSSQAVSVHECRLYATLRRAQAYGARVCDRQQRRQAQRARIDHCRLERSDVLRLTEPRATPISEIRICLFQVQFLDPGVAVAHIVAFALEL